MIPITEKACPDISGKLLTQTFRVKLNKQITNRCLFIKYVQKKKCRLTPVTEKLTSSIACYTVVSHQ